MCVIESLAVATAVTGAASAVTGYVGQRKSAAAQSKFQNEQYSEISRASLEAYNRNLNQLAIRTSQDDAAGGQEADNATRDIQSARGSAVNSSGAAGLGGTSVERAIASFDALQSETLNNAYLNRGYRLAATADQAEELKSQAQRQIVSATPQPIQRPSLLAAGLGVTQSALSAAGWYMQTKPKE
jgi:hypothetical protein